MERHTLDYYIPEKALSCQCLYIHLGSLEGDVDYSGRTHLLEHLLVAFDKRRTEEERRRYIIQAKTTFDYMCFTVYYNHYMVSDAEVHDILFSIRSARSIQSRMFEECKEDVIQEIRKFRSNREKIFVNIGNPMYVERLPVGRIEDVSAMTLPIIQKFVQEQYRKAEAELVHITVGRLYYQLKESRNMIAYKVDSQRVLNMIFYEIVFFNFIIGMGLSLAEFHMTIVSGRLFVMIVDSYAVDVEEKLKDVKIFKTGLREVRKRYANANEFNLEQQIQIAGECLCGHERILRLKNVRYMLKIQSWHRLYNEYKRYLKNMTILSVDRREMPE